MNKLFSDMKTDEEKSAFFLSGRGYETGVIAATIQNDVAMAYHRCSEYKKELAFLQAECERRAQQQPVEGEEIMVSTPYDVFILPLRTSGLGGNGPRFVVHVPGAEQPAAHPAITHCDNCGCDWLDNGLNPIGCPYCKQNAWREAFVAERAVRYCEGGMAIEQARIHAETSATLMDRQHAIKETSA